MNAGRGLRRLGRVIVHNWPLKLGAVILATLLYAGLVASQDSNTYPGPVPVTAENQPSNTVITNQLKDVEQIRYIAPADVGRLEAEDFRATVDLANVEPDGSPTTVRVNVTGVDPRVTILECPAPIHPGQPGPEGVQGGPRRRRPCRTRPRGSWSATSP